MRERQRRNVAHATWAVVARVGVDNATVRDIAAEAGCTTGLLWHHFRNREEIIDYAVDVLADEFFEEAEREWQAATPGIARLRLLIVKLAPSGARQRDRALALFRFWSGAAGHEPTSQALRAHYLRLRKIVAHFLEQAIERGEVAPDLNPLLVAEALIALGDGMCVAQTLALSDMATEPAVLVDVLLAPLTIGARNTGTSKQ